MAMAIKIAMMSTTTISSMSVKPLSSSVPPGAQLRNYVHCFPLWFVGLSTAPVRIVGNRPLAISTTLRGNLNRKHEQAERPDSAWDQRSRSRARLSACGSASSTSRSSSGSGCSTGSTGWSRAASSSVTRPFFSNDDFLWSYGLEANWGADPQGARRGARATATSSRTSRTSRPTRRRSPTTTGGRRSSSTASGSAPTTNCALCPETARLVESVPGMKTAMFSILAPAQAHPGPLRALQGHRAVPPRR